MLYNLMLYNLSMVLHTLAAVVWVGGMFFAHMALRPAALELEPPQRLALWVGVFRRFFVWVWLSVVAILVTGLWLLAQRGGFAGTGTYIHAMFAIGLVMSLLYAVIFFGPWRRLRESVAGEDWLAGAASLARIRRLVTVNLVLGLTAIVLVTGFKAW